MANFTAAPQLVVDLITYDANNKKTVMTIKEGDILKDVVYVSNGITYTKTGKIKAIMTSTTKSTNNYSNCACSLVSNFNANVFVDGFVLDASDVYDADTTMIYISDLSAIGELVNAEVEVDLNALPDTGLQGVIDALVPGQELVLGEGEVTEAVTLPAGVVIRGANAGVGASKGYRAQAVVEGETVISAPITISAGSSQTVLDGITLSGAAIIDSTVEEADLSLQNVRMVGLTNATGTDKLYPVRFLGGGDIKLTVSNSYFGDNCAEAYNLFELNCNLQSGSTIRNCYFTRDCISHNHINIYGVADGSYINIVNNVFERSKNAVRVGTKFDPTCTINVNNNTYNTTDLNEEWAGILMVQPFGTATTGMGNITVNINNTVNNTGLEQLWFYYEGANDTKLEIENRPKVFVDGVAQTYPEAPVA